MAEPSIIVYIIVIVVAFLFSLLLRIIYQRRLRREGRNFSFIHIKHENRYSLGVLVIFVGLYFILGGIIGLSFADFFDEYVENYVKQQKSFYETNTEIEFRDHEGFKIWLRNAEIYSTDSDPLIIDEERGLQASVESNTLPKSLVVHIFHEDMMNFFTDNDESSYYRQQTETLNRTLSLQYGPMFSIDFNLSEYEECDITKIEGEFCEYTFHAEDEWTFDVPGKYFVQFTAQLQNGEFDHRQSPLPLTTIMEPHDVWMENQTKRLIVLTEKQNAVAQREFGWNFLNIGIGLVVGGTAIFIPSVELRRNDAE